MTGDSQHGLSRDKSCLTHPVAFSDGVTTAVDKGRATGAVYPHLCKALGRVPQNTLLSELGRDGFG